MMGQYLRDTDDPRHYPKAQLVPGAVSRAYDSALREVDLLLLPTAPQRATPIPAADALLAERFVRTIEMTPKTCPFNLTGQPALSVPCGMADELPLGMMLVGRRGGDATVLRAGDAFRRAVFAAPPPEDQHSAPTP